MTLPDAVGAWAVQITTSGGLTGRGTGSASLTSQGVANFGQANDAQNIKIPIQTLNRVGNLVQLAKPVNWTTETSSLCRDCITTMLVLYRREADGTQSSYTASWDDTTLAQMPEDVVEIYKAVMQVKEKQFAEVRQ